MISQITIRNFQSHKEIVLDLYEGVNALVGLTGAGKSVVFKALDWLFRNRPLGDEYRSWWGGDTQVEIVLKEGQTVGRIRTDSDNFYYVDKKRFRAFGNGSPPQPVLDLLNLSDVNFQAQADPSFLISNSSGEVARYLNKAAHLDVIDQALANIAATLRREKEGLTKAKGDLEQAQEQLKEYAWLGEADGELSRLEALGDYVGQVKFQRDGLIGVVGEYEKTQKGLADQESVLAFSNETNRLVSLHDQIEKQNDDWEKLAAIIDQHEKAEEELAGFLSLERAESEVASLMVIVILIGEKKKERDLLIDLISDCEETGERLTSYDWVLDAGKEWERLDRLQVELVVSRGEKRGLEVLVKSIREMAGELSRVEISHKKLKAEFDKLMPNVCPLCEREIKK